ncbi:bMERB domain-containing protein 1-like isoform X3 [Hyla sarda]|uniref:bMERB domain-containing protein 1-like isoform X3 n=1 Tax=Hyla sarda TaxID=327740 RepID=UPI0024C2D259|nr:bMERB domain-containing protein 1-like isoform X3 [Hyla sarda]
MQRPTIRGRQADTSPAVWSSASLNLPADKSPMECSGQGISTCTNRSHRGVTWLLTMEKERRSSKQYGSLESTVWKPSEQASADDVISMADSTTTVDDIEDELFKIERIREILVRRESELRYMMDDFQLCQEITRLKKDLQILVSKADKDKTQEDRQKEEELLQRIHKLVETRDFLVDDADFERLREREEDKDMAEFLQSKLSKSYLKKAGRRRRPQSPPAPSKPPIPMSQKQD